MKLRSYLVSLATAASAFAAPAEATPTIDKRSTTISCGAFGSLATGGYTIYHNNWGSGTATSGSQCTYFNSLSSDKSIAWSSTWSWSGGAGHVKSYSNVALINVNKQLSAISSILSTWKWSNTGTNVVADVSYDLWLAPTSDGTNAYEVMVWLAAIGGALPISATGSAIATVTINNASYKLYYGLNGDTKVYSFVATSPVYSFSGDVKAFFDYLTAYQKVPSNYYVTSLQAGTEPFSGSNVAFTTSAYKMSVV
ncbi:putative Xyloglucan-specific endo-beta-1,4-glucanase A [Seiridium cardinale]